MNVSFSYENTGILTAFIILTVVGHFLVLYRTRKRVLYFSNISLLERVLAKKLFHRDYIDLFLKIMIMSLLILAVSDLKVYLNTESAYYDYVIAVDTSPSMSMNFKDVVSVSERFLSQVPVDTKVGLVTFSGESFVKTRLSADYTALFRELRNISVEIPAGTAISKALESSTSVLDDSSSMKKAIILITDGKKDEGIEPILENSFETINVKNITIFAIGINNSEYGIDYSLPEDIKLAGNVAVYVPELDEETLKLVAQRTNGTYYLAENSSSLDVAFDNIISLNKKEKEIEARTYAIYLIAILVFIQWSLGITRFKTIP